MTSTYVWKNYPLSDKHIYLFTKDDERLLFKKCKHVDTRALHQAISPYYVISSS